LALDSRTARVVNDQVNQIVGVLNGLNELRFKVESFLTTADLNNKENIYKSYELLERAASLFESYSAKHDQLARRVRKEVKYDYKPIDFIFYEIHSASIAMFQDLRKGQYSNIPGFLTRIEGAMNNFTSQNLVTSPMDKMTSSELASQVMDMVEFVSSNLSASNLPRNYNLYGKNYYLHNQSLLSYFNSISPGFVTKMNELLKSNNEAYLKYDDRPILYKVIYPQKMKEIEAIATKNVVNSDAYPLDLKLKMTPVASEPSQPYIELEFYDPDLLDRDSISVSFNGDMLLTDYKLETVPKELKLDLKSDQANIIKIKACNTGIIPDNSVAFKYRFNGKGRKRFMKMNLKKDQEISIELDKKELKTEIHN